MPKYKITDPDVTHVSLGGSEYRVRDGLLVIPDSDRAAIAATAHIGLTPVPEKSPGAVR
jgi:hypothetical protein